jgi:sortase A
VERFRLSALKTLKKLSKKLKKLHKKYQKYYLSTFAVFFGLAIFSFGAYNYFSIRILSFAKPPPETVVVENRAELPAKINIPDLKIDLVVEEGFIQNGIWQISEKGASHLNTSARPGEGGNIIIYGHNKKVIFGSLPFAQIGTKIIITDKNGKIYNYEVTDKLRVNPSRVDLLYPTDSEQLTIYTCTGPFDSQRFVIKAKPI